MWSAVLTISILALLAGLALALARRSLPTDSSAIVEPIHDLLPHTQCAQCGYPGCRPYAEAIAEGDAEINLCPPGGQATVQRLADLLGRDALPLAEPATALTPGSVAVIDEARCIGCTHCRSACPVDAIVGAHQLMHTVITSECTGCELCIAPCPVDCIAMVAAK